MKKQLNNTLSKIQKSFLDKNGYLILRNIKVIKKNLKQLQREANKLIDLEGDKGGWEGKEKYYKKGKHFEKGTDRLGNLIEKHKIFRKLITIPEILEAAKEVTKSEIKICGLNLRNPKKGFGYQKIHTDWKPRKRKKESFAGIVCMIYLDNSKKRNGATRIIPKTHKIIGWPDNHINIDKKHKKEIRPEIKAGGVIIANLNLWHAGANNKSGEPRKMIMVNIKNRKFPQLLNYKIFLSNKCKKSLTDFEKYILAVRKVDIRQKSDSIGVGKYYKKEFGAKRD